MMTSPMSCAAKNINTKRSVMGTECFIGENYINRFIKSLFVKRTTSIKVAYFQKEGEDAAALNNAFTGLFTFELTKEKIPTKHTHASGFNEKPIDIYEVMLKKDRHMNAFLASLSQRLLAE